MWRAETSRKAPVCTPSRSSASEPGDQRLESERSASSASGSGVGRPVVVLEDRPQQQPRAGGVLRQAVDQRVDHAVQARQRQAARREGRRQRRLDPPEHPPEHREVELELAVEVVEQGGLAEPGGLRDLAQATPAKPRRANNAWRPQDLLAGARLLGCAHRRSGNVRSDPTLGGRMDRSRRRLIFIPGPIGRTASAPPGSRATRHS
jgi:hypothetical protein